MTARRKRSEADRFWAKVRPEPGDACWLWTASTNAHGYGKFGTTYLGPGTSKTIAAHRWSWEFNNGPVPDGLGVLHKCDVRLCVNPAHLFLGTNGDNNRDAQVKGRTQQGERHYAAKLDAASVAAVRVRYAAGDVSQTQLAAEYGVTQGAIGMALRLKTWKGVK